MLRFVSCYLTKTLTLVRMPQNVGKIDERNEEILRQEGGGSLKKEKTGMIHQILDSGGELHYVVNYLARKICPVISNECIGTLKYKQLIPR